MELVPEPVYAAESDPASRRIVVLVPRFTDPIGRRLLQPRLGPGKRHIRVPLDERGTFLWELLDGCRPIAELSAAFEQRFPDDADQAATRVCAYLHELYERKFIRYLNLSR